MGEYGAVRCENPEEPCAHYRRLLHSGTVRDQEAQNNPSHFLAGFVRSGPWPVKVFCSDDVHRHWVRERKGGVKSDLSASTLDRLPLCLSESRFLNEMSEINFRKIDIDVYDEDVLVETELYDADPRDPAQVLNGAKQKATAVRSALSK